MLILFILLLSYFHIHPPPISISSDIIERHPALIGIGTIIIAIIIFLATVIKQDSDRKEETRKRLLTACQLISQEVEEFRRRLSDNSRIVRDLHPEFFNIHFNFDGYESVLHSGLFSHFDEETQFEIKALYERIKLHNEFSMYRLSLQNQYFLYNESREHINRWPRIIQPINFSLHQLEIEINQIIEDVMDSLTFERERITG